MIILCGTLSINKTRVLKPSHRDSSFEYYNTLSLMCYSILSYISVKIELCILLESELNVLNY